MADSPDCWLPSSLLSPDACLPSGFFSAGSLNSGSLCGFPASGVPAARGDRMPDFHDENHVSLFQEAILPPGSNYVMRTSNPQMQAVLRKVATVAPTESTVLFTGETGTGKTVLARILHYQSLRRKHPFVSVQCSAVAEGLLESELFGHEKGAFTGAIRRKPGKFELAQHGSIFLDEIGTISATAQIKLLKVLEEKEFQRVGGEETIHCDVRIIAATNSDLKQLILEGTFRSDLYYRLNVFPIEVPPLRERREDIPLLVDAFLQRLDKVYRKRIFGLEPAVLEAFQRYAWPGNVRELENLIERAYILESGSVLRAENFPSDLFGTAAPPPPAGIDASRPLRDFRAEWTRHAEAAYLRALLQRHSGRIASSARAAGIGVRQLHKLLARHGIRKEEFRS